MESKKKTTNLIQEIFFIRSIACMSVVFIHAITTSSEGIGDTTLFQLLKNIQLILMFATPIFVFISEFTLAYSYSEKSPPNFWRKRIQFILLPYLFCGFLYVFLNTEKPINLDAFLGRLLQVYLGEWHGYFVIIIFQFYLIHYLFSKYLVRFSAKWVIAVAFVINFAFLYHLNFAEKFKHSWAVFFYEHAQLFFVGWIFYFAVAYYCGVHFSSFLRNLKKYRYWVLGALAVNLIIILFLMNGQILSITSSKRVDILPYTILVMFTLYYLAHKKIGRVPNIIFYISQASYTIYLLHPLIQGFLIRKLKIGLLPSILLLFVAGVSVPLGIAFLLQHWKYGPYLVGKVRFISR